MLKNSKLLWLVGFVFYKFVNADIDIPELKYLDKSVDPCDNFYKFTCGNFKEVHPLPDGAKNIDEFSILQEKIHLKAKEILELPISDTNPVAVKKAKAFYRSCLDVKYTDQMAFPFLTVLEGVGGWPVINTTYTDSRKNIPKPTWPQIGDYIAEYGLPLFFDLEVVPSQLTANSNVVYLTPAGLSNPEAGIYARLSDDFDFLGPAARNKRDAERETPYFKFLKKMATELKKITMSYKDDREIVEEIKTSIEYLRRIRDGGVPSTGEISILPMEATITQLQNWTDIYFGDKIELNWIDFLNHAFKYSGAKVTKDTKVMQSNIKVLWGLLELYRTSNVEDIMNYVVARLLIFTAADGNAFMRNTLEEFYEVMKCPVFERKEYCLRKTLGYSDRIDFSFAVTAEYQRYFWDVNKWKRAEILEKDLEFVLNRVIENLQWMAEEDKKKADKKVDALKRLVGYPSLVTKREDLDRYYENLRVCTWDHFGNSQRLRAFNRAKNFMEIGNERTVKEWTVSPLVVNAFYNRAANRITLPVSILNPVFFGNGNESLLNFARLGSIIGHEITHGFDNTGRLYDEQGKLGDWWSKETKNKFEEQAKCFEEQYSDYLIEEIEANVNGSRTLNENLADNGGLKLGYNAWMRRERNSSVLIEPINGFTKEQLFFIAYGTMWCSLETDEYLEALHKQNTYSPARYRVIGSVSNMNEFSKAFNCPKKSSMNPEKKCTLW